MGNFTALIFDLSPAATRDQPRPVPQPLEVDLPQMLRMFRRWLLKTPRDFSAKVRLPATVKGQAGELQIELRWLAAGDTVGVAFWSNRDHTVAASILLNGLESAQDLARVEQVLAGRGYAIPPPLRKVIDDEKQRPLMATLVYSHGAMQFRALLTVMPSFARAFFDLFGTTGP
jgi:hypothetical protein